MPGVSGQQMSRLLDFLYTGETSVDHQQIQTFLQLAQQLDIKQLCSEEINKTYSLKPDEEQISETVYGCEICEKTFNRKGSLTRHFEFYHERKGFPIEKKELSTSSTDTKRPINFEEKENEHKAIESNNDPILVERESVQLEIPFAEGETIFEASQVFKVHSSACWKFLFFKGSIKEGPDKSRVFCKLCSTNSAHKERFSKGLSYNGQTTNLNHHLRSHHPAEFQSSRGPEVQDASTESRSLADLLNGMFTLSESQCLETRYRCNRCDRTSQGLLMAREHAETHLDNLAFPCRSCPRLFRSSRALRSHRVTECK